MSYINSKGEIIRGHDRFIDESFLDTHNHRRKSVSYKRWLILLLVVLIGVSTAILNPTCEDFTEYLKSNSKGKVRLSTKLLSKLRLSYCSHSLFWSSAKYNNQNYFGIYAHWLENNMFDPDAISQNYYVKHITRTLGRPLGLFDVASVDDTELLITIYIIVYCLWVLILPYNFMSNHFAVSRINLKARRIYTLITSSFAHNEVMHMGMNIVMLMTIGDVIQPRISRMHFWMLYIFSGVCGAIGSLLFHPIRYQSIGASGSLYGLYGYLASTSVGEGLYVTWMGQNLSMGQALIASIMFGAFMSRGVLQGADNAMHIAGALGGCLFPSALAVLESFSS